MAESKQREAWNHTAAVMALLANIHRGKGRSAYSPNDFNPFAPKKIKGTIHDFKVLLKNRGKAGLN